MEKISKELTVGELLELIRWQEGEFIIYIEPGREETDAETL